MIIVSSSGALWGTGTSEYHQPIMGIDNSIGIKLFALVTDDHFKPILRSSKTQIIGLFSGLEHSLAA
jgi:hypothetical protein